MGIEEIAAGSDDWMTALLKSPVIRRLPPINLQKIIMGLKVVDFKKDDVILAQGSEGDYYYLIKNGECLCTRKVTPTAKSIKIRQLTTGDTFGEDALISGAPRDLTITALTDVSLLRLEKQQFVSLIKEPSLSFVTYLEMQEAIKKGAILLDVSTPEAYKKQHIEGSINEPFFSLRIQLKTLSREKPFIVVCSDGKASEAAAFLLLNNHFKAKILRGGIACVMQEQGAEISLVINADDSGRSAVIATPPENSGREHGIGQSAGPASVFSNAFKSLFVQNFEQLVDGCCMQIDFEFGMQLGRKRETMGKDQYAKLQEYLRSVRNDIKQSYITKVNDNFDNTYQAVANNRSDQYNLSQVSLITEEAAKENGAVDMIIRQCEHLFHDELAELNKKFPIQPGRQVIAGSSNPIFPDKLVRALVDVVKPLKLNTENKIVLYKTFEANVFSQLGLIYRQLLSSPD